MKAIERNEILAIGPYEEIREAFRTRIIQEKKRRRLQLGDRITMVFETHDSVLLQIQEMLRTERITREAAIVHEIETYQDMVPKRAELSATAMIEIDDKAVREQFLEAAMGLTREIFLEVNGEHCAAVARAEPTERLSAVLYLKFPMSETAWSAIGAKGVTPNVRIVARHPAYKAEHVLSASMLAALREDADEA
jgi:Protein of unknown function (DUF3501)